MIPEILSEEGQDITFSEKELAKRITERIKNRQHDMWVDLRLMQERRLYRALGYSEIEEWGEQELGWKRRYTFYQLKASGIYGLLKVHNCALLPTNEGQIRPLARLEKHDDYTDEVLVEKWREACEWAKENGFDSPNASHVDYVVSEFLYEPPPPLPTGHYRAIYADPPWKFDNAGFDESAASHYPVMETIDIAALAIPPADVCFMWATNAMLEDALFVLKEWGFNYKANMAWIKRKGPSIGWYVQSRHELLLIGTNGKSKHPEWKPQSWFEGPVTKHSKKPAMAYELIEKMYEGPYLELFAREARKGWDVWGNEANETSQDRAV